MPMSEETRQKIRESMLRHYERRPRDENVKPKYIDSLRGYGFKVMQRDKFECQYCGYDGKCFLGWLQLTLDHIIPIQDGGVAEENNLLTVCHACNSMTSRMRFSEANTRGEIVQKKKQKVQERQKDYFAFWQQNVLSLLVTVS